MNDKKVETAQIRNQGEGTPSSRSGDKATYNAVDFNCTFTHHTAKVNDVRLHYVMGGKGEPLVMLHGFPQTWYQWRHVMPALAERYTVLALDMRGMGDSSKPLNGYDKRTVAADIYELMRQLGYKRINLVGHDLGMMVAYAYAAAHPEEVGRLVVIDAPLPGTKTFDQISRDPRAWHFAFHSAADIPEALVAGKERLYLTSFYQGPLALNPGAFTEEDIDEYVRAYSVPGAMRAAFDYYRAFPTDAEHNQESAKSKLQMPILALSPSSIDGGKSESYMVSMMQEVAKNVRDGVIEGSGHWICEEQPAELTRRLLAFFQ
ncbi:alpha/beta hydrolase fold protein (plasmid) [Scytonema sp. HK-05]|uniref:alpha/beta fold hydrolase n=1 Tax=Scytonema sp. HK-05 TaxID=1137095 RepID=UPI0009F9DC22|nr:alpha/beta hydrolase [Scytonema sp. HK-05]BAY50456.1 alpha/beta hydrolase fold protein [Scytonema sp. HK-05]